MVEVSDPATVFTVQYNVSRYVGRCLRYSYLRYKEQLKSPFVTAEGSYVAISYQQGKRCVMLDSGLC